MPRHNPVRVTHRIQLENTSGTTLRLTAYDSHMVRVQYVLEGETFLPDDHYEMVEDHTKWNGQFTVSENAEFLELTLVGRPEFGIEVHKGTLQIAWIFQGERILQDEKPFSAMGDTLLASFRHDKTEHFTGLGHGFYGRAERIDLSGTQTGRNYGKFHHEQAPLLVPFYLSSKGYGLFLHSRFPNFFNFGNDGKYELGIRTSGFKGRMDYFFLLGPEFSEILHAYVALTGKPRLPQLSIFGLHLSDKGHDHTTPTPSDEVWWREQIRKQRAAGFPLDHVVNDNRWRAGGGKRCQSYFDWDTTRYPDPAQYALWLNDMGLTSTLDFNRCIAQYSDGWDPAFNLPDTDSISFRESAPDLTNPAFRDWFWHLFYEKAFDPDLGYPGDGMWIDEFDEMGNAPDTMILSNGRSFAEMRNAWFYLIAKALVKEGWDQSIGIEKRPYLWVRGMSAGGQRYGTMWSGDIKPNFEDMRMQIRGMQLAGLSGFPYWGHDAGGFYDYQEKAGPDEELYQKWAMAYGSFSPLWRPHGMGLSRWPIDRSEDSQIVAHIYGDLRYALMPYTYTYAYLAHMTGAPIARPMVWSHQDREEAWEYDLQYWWGDQLLVAPLCGPSDTVETWLPPGLWYNYWTDALIPGDQVTALKGSAQQIPLLVKAGAILVTTPSKPGTQYLDYGDLEIHVYPGADGQFSLYEDDGVSERFRLEDQYRVTPMRFWEKEKTFRIEPATGHFEDAPESRNYHIVFHAMPVSQGVSLHNQDLPMIAEGEEEDHLNFARHDAGADLLHVFLRNQGTEKQLEIGL